MQDRLNELERERQILITRQDRAETRRDNLVITYAILTVPEKLSIFVADKVIKSSLVLTRIPPYLAAITIVSLGVSVAGYDYVKSEIKDQLSITFDTITDIHRDIESNQIEQRIVEAAAQYEKEPMSESSFDYVPPSRQGNYGIDLSRVA